MKVISPLLNYVFRFMLPILTFFYVYMSSSIAYNFLVFYSIIFIFTITFIFILSSLLEMSWFYIEKYITYKKLKKENINIAIKFAQRNSAYDFLFYLQLFLKLVSIIILVSIGHYILGVIYFVGTIIEILITKSIYQLSLKFKQGYDNFNSSFFENLN